MESISIEASCSYVCVIQGCDVILTSTHSSNERHMTNTPIPWSTELRRSVFPAS